MTLKASLHRYGSLAIALHWAIAASIPIMIVLGLSAAYSSDLKRQALLLRVHVSLGIFVLILAVVRVAWRLFDRRPAQLGGPQWQRAASRTVHLLLLALPIVAGASGLGLMILSGAGPILFSGVTRPLPRFADFPPMVAHIAAAFALTALIGLHVAGALYHQLVRRDRLLARMGVGRSRPKPVFIPEETL